MRLQPQQSRVTLARGFKSLTTLVGTAEFRFSARLILGQYLSDVLTLVISPVVPAG